MLDRNRRSGFTLIEVMVVMVIVALAGSFMVIGYNQLLQRKAAAQIEELQAWLEAAADISILQSTVLGVTRMDNQLKLMAFFHGDWFLLADQVALDIGEDIQITWPEELLDSNVTETAEDDQPQPYLVLTPAGDILPEGRIGLRVGEQQASINWQESGAFTLAWQ
ncbi:MAG: prepilin-type N-terminal cleavage/methylation domain-containing protein [Pseudomonadales bacterium]